jgi:hypothetical protein
VIATTLSVDERSNDKRQHPTRVNKSEFTDFNDFNGRSRKRDRSRYGDGSDSVDIVDMVTLFEFRRQLVLTFGNARQKIHTQRWDTVRPAFNKGVGLGSYDDFKIEINLFNIWFEELRLPLKNWFVSGFKTQELQRLEKVRLLLPAICQAFINVLEDLKVANTSNGEEDVQIVDEQTLDERNKAGFAGAVDLDPSDGESWDEDDLIDLYK